MADKDDFLVKLSTAIDKTGAVKDIDKLKKELEKKKINLEAVLNPTLDKQQLENYAVQIQEIFNENGVDIDVSKIISSLNQVSEQAETVMAKIKNVQDSINALDYDKKSQSTGDTVKNTAKSDDTSWLDNLLSNVKEITKALELWKSILAGIELFDGTKNVG